ncbi:MAG: type II toxin-antitoxin system MqsA family antitoxin [Phycisphaeraceae bacterium]|nr:MAG: type II toxin-antitoxin system MqsA family antitoxin [Phycisphaeraceae bacterium]
MNQTPCPICGKNSLAEKHGEYRFEPPEAIPGGAIVVPDATWYECGACHEQIVPPALENAIERERYRRLGLLTPEEIKAVRERTGLSAVDMATLLSVGEKTYTRWENGRSLQNKSNDTLIRLVDRNAEIFEIVEAERQPGREAMVRNYVINLETLKGRQDVAMAAHGADLSTSDFEAIRVKLVELRGIKRAQG